MSGAIHRFSSGIGIAAFASPSWDLPRSVVLFDTEEPVRGSAVFGVCFPSHDPYTGWKKVS